MSPLETQFQTALAASKQLSERPDNATLLQLYGLYKQATDGDARGPRPGLAEFVARAKFDAWQALQGRSSEAAMQAYIELIESLQ